MRAAALVMFILFAAPVAGAALIPQAPLAPLDVAPLLPGPRDGDVMAWLGEYKGIRVTRIPTPDVPADLTLPLMVQRLAARVGQPLAPADVAQFAALDPDIQAPVLTLLVAMEHAWDMRDAAFARHSAEALYDHHMSLLAGEAVASVVLPDEQEMLLTAAIMLADTVDSIVLPQLAALAQSPHWPATATFDTVGILRIGGTGNDRETLDRMLQIDPRGNDKHLNNAGATTMLNDLNPATPDFPVSISLDLSGNDYYARNISRQGIGGAFAGIGYALDLAGNDKYECLGECIGSGADGIGVFRDVTGQDWHYAATRGGGFGAGGFFGMLRDDAGDDAQLAGPDTMGVGLADGLGLYWDRAGTDEYITGGCKCIWGYAEVEGAGWLVDEGGTDIFRGYEPGREIPSWVCNDCTWSAGEHLRGRGNNDAGGLEHLLARQRTWPRG